MIYRKFADWTIESTDTVEEYNYWFEHLSTVFRELRCLKPDFLPTVYAIESQLKTASVANVYIAMRLRELHERDAEGGLAYPFSLNLHKAP